MTRTYLEILGLPLGNTWDIVPAPGWDAKDQVCGEAEGGDRLEREHCRRRGGQMSREWESERGTGSFGGARGVKTEERRETTEGATKRSCEAETINGKKVRRMKPNSLGVRCARVANKSGWDEGENRDGTGWDGVKSRRNRTGLRLVLHYGSDPVLSTCRSTSVSVE